MPICDFRRGMLNARLRARIQHLLPGHRLAQHIPQFPVFDSSERQRAFRLSYSAYSKVVFGKWQFSGLIKTSFKKKNQRTNTIFSERGLNASPQANIQPAVIESQIQATCSLWVRLLACGNYYFTDKFLLYYILSLDLSMISYYNTVSTKSYFFYERNFL